MKQLTKDIVVALEYINKNFLMISLVLFFAASCATGPKTTVAKGTKKQPKKTAQKEDIYRAGPRTKIWISVYNEPELTGAATVDPRGNIDHGYLGRIQVKGLTPAQIAKKIRQKLKRDYLVHPRVKVKVLEYGQVYVFGNVMDPGIVSLKGRINPLEAVAEAGGFSSGAKRNWLTVVRIEQRKKKTYRISLRETEHGRVDLLQSLHLLPEDTVIVQ